MRIAFVVDSYLGMTGGIQNSVQLFKRGFEETGHTVGIFTDDPPRLGKSYPDIHLVPSLKLYHMPKHDADVKLPLSLLPSSLRDFQPDIIHAHKSSPLGFFAWLWARRLAVPFVFTYHTALTKVGSYYSSLDRLGGRFYDQLAVWLVKLSDVVIAPGKPVKDYLRQRQIKTPIHVIQTGVDLGRFAKVSVLSRNQLGIGVSDYFILNVERATKDKRQDFLIEAFSYLVKRQLPQKIHFVIACEGPYKQELIRLVDTLQLTPYVHFLGILTENDLTGLYKSADIFVMASLSETQGMVPLEAAAAGLPIIAVQDETLSYCIHDRVNGQLTANTPADFCDVLATLLTDTKLRKKYGQAALTIARNYSYQEQAKKMIAIYENLRKQQNRKLNSD